MQIRTGPLYRSREKAQEAADKMNAIDPVPSWKVIVSRRAPDSFTIISERP